MELRKVNRRKAQVKLPKLGWVKFRASRSLDGETIRSATLSKDGERWFVSFLVEDGKTPPVPAAFTSQRCSVCGHVDPKSRESQAVFRCIYCTHSGHADVNAAKNILAAGLAVTACEDRPRPAGWVRSSKQEPAGNREELLLQPQNAASAA